MKKTTLSLLAFCMYCTQNAPTNAAEEQGDKYGHTPKYGNTPMTDHDGKQALLSDLYPTDETSAHHLDNALFGDFDPEERDDERDKAEERQFALLKSRIMDYIPRIMEKLRLEDMAAEETGPGIIPQELPPSQKVPEIAVELKEPVNVQAPENEGPQQNLIAQSMLEECPKVWLERGKPSHTIEELTTLFFQYSQENAKEWLKEECHQIAGRLKDQANEQMIDECSKVWREKGKPTHTIEKLTTLFFQYSQENGKEWLEEDCQRIAHHLKNQITQPMVTECAQVWLKKGDARNTREDLAALFFQHSKENKKGWPEKSCQRIAGHLFDADDLH